MRGGEQPARKWVDVEMVTKENRREKGSKGPSRRERGNQRKGEEKRREEKRREEKRRVGEERKEQKRRMKSKGK